jgi:hypothetical protein
LLQNCNTCGVELLLQRGNLVCVFKKINQGAERNRKGVEFPFSKIGMCWQFPRASARRTMPIVRGGVAADRFPVYPNSVQAPVNPDNRAILPENSKSAKAGFDVESRAKAITGC